MIIHDLDHLESFSEQTNSNSSDILGRGFILEAPIINLKPFVKASSNPSRLLMTFEGLSVGGDFSLMQVFQEGFVSARFDF